MPSPGSRTEQHIDGAIGENDARGDVDNLRIPSQRMCGFTRRVVTPTLWSGACAHDVPYSLDGQFLEPRSLRETSKSTSDVVMRGDVPKFN